jgi:hypothetical protein
MFNNVLMIRIVKSVKLSYWLLMIMVINGIKIVDFVLIHSTENQTLKSRKIDYVKTIKYLNLFRHTTPAPPPRDEPDNITSPPFSKQRNPNENEFDQKQTHTSSTSKLQTTTRENNSKVLNNNSDIKISNFTFKMVIVHQEETMDIVNPAKIHM